MTTTPLGLRPVEGDARRCDDRKRLDRAALLDLAGPLAGLEVLVVGCGDASYALATAEAGGRVVGVDASQTVMEVAHRGAVAELRTDFLAGAASALPFGAGRFDEVLAVAFDGLSANPVPKNTKSA